MKEKIIENKQIIMLVLSILLIIIGATYAWFTWVSKDNTNLNLTIGEIAEVVYTSGDTISATNIGPVLDINDGEATSFSFKKRVSGLHSAMITIMFTRAESHLRFMCMLNKSITTKATIQMPIIRSSRYSI